MREQRPIGGIKSSTNSVFCNGTFPFDGLTTDPRTTNRLAMSILFRASGRARRRLDCVCSGLRSFTADYLMEFASGVSPSVKNGTEREACDLRRRFLFYFVFRVFGLLKTEQTSATGGSLMMPFDGETRCRS